MQQTNHLHLIITVAVLVLVLGISGCGPGQVQKDNHVQKETFSYAMSGLYKPFNYTKSGKLVGFDVDIGREISERMGMEPEPVTNPWQTIIQGLKVGKYDAIIGSMAITEKRQEQVDFSAPYYRSGAQVFVQKNNETIDSSAQLHGKRIGVVKASTFRNVALELTSEDNVIGYDSDVIALQDLTTGRLDAVITDRVVGLAAINDNSLPIKDIGTPLYIDEMGIAVAKDEAALLRQINAALQAMIADGTYENISRRWFGRNILNAE